MEDNMDNNIKNRKILIVDDEVELLNLLKMVLTIYTLHKMEMMP